MIIWLTAQLFELMFNTTLSGEALLFIQFFSFVELLAEMFGVGALIGLEISERKGKL